MKFCRALYIAYSFVAIVISLAYVSFMCVGCGAPDKAGLDSALIIEPLVSERAEPEPDDASDALIKSDTPAPTKIIPPESNRIGADLSVSRGMAAKMLALLLYTPGEIDSMEREITYSDSEPSMWFDKYINACYVHGCMKGGGETFLPNSPLTLEQTRVIINKLDVDKVVNFRFADVNGQKPISFELWADIYISMLNYYSETGTIANTNIRVESVVVLAASGNHTKLANWHAITDIGPMKRAGLNLNSYIDKRISVLIEDDEIIAPVSIDDDAPIIKNAYVVNCSSKVITIFCGGAERTFALNNNITQATGYICDIHIKDGEALDVTLKSRTISGVVTKTTDTEIEIDGRVYAQSDSFKVYSTADGPVKWKSAIALIVGADIAVFFLDNEQICAAVIQKAATPEVIRVALNTTGFEGLIHENVIGACNTPYILQTDEYEKSCDPGEIFNANDLPFNKLRVIPTETDALIEIQTISRSWPGGENPKYAGVIEIEKTPGGYTVVNELPLEQYLYSVVPSEMPSGFGVEAAKVQAVAARSYAYNQFYQNKFHNYGAHIDDSVSCQVYNNIPANEVSIEGVDATRGMTLAYNGSVINATYYSTSAGVTANSGEVWPESQTQQFPTASSPYLVSSREYTGVDYGDLTLEDNVTAFFKAQDVPCYDNEFAWFRWDVRLTRSQLTESINAALPSRYKAAPALIKTLQPDGVFRSRPIESIGALTGLEVVSRGQGGNILEIIFYGANATISVETEYNIRALLAPRSATVRRKDGTTADNLTLLPSAFFVFDSSTDSDGSLAAVTIYGGGFGHGAGMSQNGVKGMIDKGFNYIQILAHYYPGTDIKSID